MAQLWVKKGFDAATNNAPHVPIFIGTLNNDVLLIIFNFCRLAVEEEVKVISDEGNWNFGFVRPRWWHTPTQICQRWRSLIFASPSRLNLYVVCTKVTPIEEILAYFPHLPLEVNYMFLWEREQRQAQRNVLLSLQRRHHLRSINLRAPDAVLQRMVIPLDDEFPLLDRLAIISDDQSFGASSGVTLPKTLRAPNLRHLILENFDLQIGAPILTTSIQLVSLGLWRIPASTHIPPEYLVDLFVLMPQLRAVSVSFRANHDSPIPHSGVGTYPLLAPEAPNLFFTLCCLEELSFTGYSTYLEGILACIIAPVLRKFDVFFLDQHSYGTLPNLSRFLNATAELSFRVAMINFDEYCVIINSGDQGGDIRPSRGDKLPFCLCGWVDPSTWHIASASDICNTFGPVFSVTEELILGHYHKYDTQSERRGNVNRVNWRTILRQFRNIKTLSIPNELIEELSLSLEPDCEGYLALLPELQQIVVTEGFRKLGNEFDAFIVSRRIAGRPVNVNVVHESWY